MNNKFYDILSTKRLYVVSSSLIIAMTFLAGCWGSKEQQKESQLVIINVLDASYFDDCHIKGSINIPFESFEDKLKTLDKNNHYVVYCSNYACTAAPFAVQLMKDAGFADARLLPGGIVEWYQKKYPYNGPALLQYLQEENQPLDEDAHGAVALVSSEKLLEELQAAKIV